MKAEDEAAQTADLQDVRAWDIAKEMEKSPGLLEKVLEHLNKPGSANKAWIEDWDEPDNLAGHPHHDRCGDS